MSISSQLSITDRALLLINNSSEVSLQLLAEAWYRAFDCNDEEEWEEARCFAYALVDEDEENNYSSEITLFFQHLPSYESICEDSADCYADFSSANLERDYDYA